MSSFNTSSNTSANTSMPSSRSSQGPAPATTAPTTWTASQGPAPATTAPTTWTATEVLCEYRRLLQELDPILSDLKRNDDNVYAPLYQRLFDYEMKIKMNADALGRVRERGDRWFTAATIFCDFKGIEAIEVLREYTKLLQELDPILIDLKRPDNVFCAGPHQRLLEYEMKIKMNADALARVRERGGRWFDVATRIYEEPEDLGWALGASYWEDLKRQKRELEGKEEKEGRYEEDDEEEEEEEEWTDDEDDDDYEDDLEFLLWEARFDLADRVYVQRWAWTSIPDMARLRADLFAEIREAYRARHGGHHQEHQGPEAEVEAIGAADIIRLSLEATSSDTMTMRRLWSFRGRLFAEMREVCRARAAGHHRHQESEEAATEAAAMVPSSALPSSSAITPAPETVPTAPTAPTVQQQQQPEQSQPQEHHDHDHGHDHDGTQRPGTVKGQLCGGLWYGSEVDFMWITGQGV